MGRKPVPPSQPINDTIEAIRRKRLKEDALEALVHLRGGAMVGLNPSLLRIAEAEEDGISLEELGTTADEVKGFPRASARLCAQEAILRMRRQPDCDPPFQVEQIAEALFLGVTPAEIGATQRELRTLPWRDCILDASRVGDQAQRVQRFRLFVSAAYLVSVPAEMMGLTEDQVQLVVVQR